MYNVKRYQISIHLKKKYTEQSTCDVAQIIILLQNECFLWNTGISLSVHPSVCSLVLLSV